VTTTNTARAGIGRRAARDISTSPSRRGWGSCGGHALAQIIEHDGFGAELGRDAEPEFDRLDIAASVRKNHGRVAAMERPVSSACRPLPGPVVDAIFQSVFHRG